MLITNSFPSGPYPEHRGPHPEHCFSVNENQSYGKDHGCFAKEMDLAREFLCSHDYSFVVVTVTWKPFPEVLLCLKLGQTLEVFDTVWAKVVTQVSFLASGGWFPC